MKSFEFNVLSKFDSCGQYMQSKSMEEAWTKDEKRREESLISLQVVCALGPLVSVFVHVTHYSLTPLSAYSAGDPIGSNCFCQDRVWQAGALEFGKFQSNSHDRACIIKRWLGFRQGGTLGAWLDWDGLVPTNQSIFMYFIIMALLYTISAAFWLSHLPRPSCTAVLCFPISLRLLLGTETDSKGELLILSFHLYGSFQRI